MRLLLFCSSRLWHVNVHDNDNKTIHTPECEIEREREKENRQLNQNVLYSELDVKLSIQVNTKSKNGTFQCISIEFPIKSRKKINWKLWERKKEARRVHAALARNESDNWTLQSITLLLFYMRLPYMVWCSHWYRRPFFSVVIENVTTKNCNDRILEIFCVQMCTQCTNTTAAATTTITITTNRPKKKCAQNQAKLVHSDDRR